MQNGAQKIQNGSGRLLGFVRVLVGGQFYELPVQAVTIQKDGERSAGGFFSDDGRFGILVDESADGAKVQTQIEAATEEAVRHLSKKLLN